MARVTPQEAAEKHARRLTAAGEDIRRGIERVTEAPGRAAAAQQVKMLANTTEAITSGKWARRVAAVPLEEWKRQATDKGLARIGPGIAAARQKQEEFYAKLLPFVDTARTSIRAMPSTTLDDRINRMVSFSRKMAEFSK